MKNLVSVFVMIVSTIVAAIALVLPWKVRCIYSAILRWFRDILMQNSRGIRKWALKARWEWDSHE